MNHGWRARSRRRTGAAIRSLNRCARPPRRRPHGTHKKSVTMASNATPSPSDALEELYDHQQLRDDADHNFHSIVDHSFVNSTLILTVKYVSDLTDDCTLKVPFSILKKDVPLELARYIRAHMMDPKRNGYYATWLKRMLRTHNRYVRCLYRIYNIDHAAHILKQRQRISQNSCNQQNKKRENSVSAFPTILAKLLCLIN